MSAADELEPLLARCLERYGEEGMEAVERELDAQPALAERVRARFAELARLGLLGGERDARPERFGPYRVLRRLGQGGMGTVWLALDERLGRRVALKAAHVVLDETDRTRERFQREVRAYAQLAHPCIVPILDVGEAHGRPYFTMEYVEGATLARVIEELARRGTPLAELTGEDVRQVALEGAEPAEEHAAQADEGPWSRGYLESVCRIALDLADALAHAHAHGVIHRDVKPSNVLVRRDGRAQLVDLGLAHLVDQPSLTRSGDLAGTPSYLAPEQARGERGAVDARTDVHALGVTLYELLTLRRPYDGRTTAELLEAIQRREPPLPRRWNPRIPADLETICLTALEKDPARRYASMEAFAADLRRLLAFEPVRARPIGALRRLARTARRNPAPSLAGLLAVVLLVGSPAGLLWTNARVRAQRDLARAAARAAEREARLKSRVTDFLVELYAPEASSSAAESSAREFLERGARRVESDFGDEPLVRAALMEALGRAHANLGLLDDALPLLDRAFALRQRELGEAHPEVASVLATLAGVHLAAGHDDVALALARRSLAGFESASRGAPMPAQASEAAAIAARVTLAEAAARLGDARLAEEQLERALEQTRAGEAQAGAAGRAPRAAELEERLAELALARGAPALAAERLERALAAREAALAPDPVALLRAYERLAPLERARGAKEAAERAERRAGELADLLARRTHAPPERAGQSDTLRLADLRPSWHEQDRASFQQGITALQAGRTREAIAAFERCLAWRPDHAVCAYNIACAHASAGEGEAGFAALERAVALGFGDREEQVALAAEDADVASLRADPRWPALVARMRARGEALRAVGEATHLRLPVLGGAGGAGDASSAERERPLLVVLHAEGSGPRAVLAGPWAALADELGLVLLAPAGGLSASARADGARGSSSSAADPSEALGAQLAWYEELDDLARRPLESEERVLAQVRAACEQHAIDPRRVVLAGERSAAPLAFDLAVRAPGLFRGVLLVDGPPLPSVAEERTRAAALLGLRVELARTGAASPWPSTLGAEELAARATRWLAERGLAAEAEEAGAPSPGGGIESLRCALARALAPLGTRAR